MNTASLTVAGLALLAYLAAVALVFARIDKRAAERP